MKIQGKFYPLTSEITSKLRKGKLTAAEWRIWSYLVEIDPWGDRYQDIDSLDVMSKCDCSRATFYRAIAKFQKLGIFDIQDKGFSIRNLTGASWLKSSQAEEQGTKLNQVNLRNEKSVSKIILDSQNCESDLKNEKSVSKMRLDSQICENQPPESPPDKDLTSPQTLQTYSDFKRSLSESEGENFLIFVKEETKNLERKINDLEAWLASKNAAKQNRWEIYYKNFQEEKKYEKFKITKQNQGSENYDPQKLQDVIKRFQNRGRTDASEPKNEVENETKEIDREEIKRQQAEINRLMDNPPEYETRKSPAQQRRDAIAEAKRKQEEWNLERKRLDAERQRQQELDEPDPEARKAKMIRETEEFLRNRQQQQQNPEIGEEDRDYE